MTARQPLFRVLVAALALGWVSTAWAPPGGIPTCQTKLNTCTADLTATQASLNTCNADLSTCQADLAAPQFPATGQTTCYDSFGVIIDCDGTGQDGEIQAGADLSYTDNMDGTITDNNTGLMWAKKSGETVSNIHSVANLYSWQNAFAEHVSGLNTDNFAGYNDWRLPNVKELQSIVNYGSSGARVAGVQHRLHIRRHGADRQLYGGQLLVVYYRR
ncbi:MAG: DUF1566 domain-containing protein [Gammaproteobacteria bacterium]